MATYVRKRGRMTAGQARAMAELQPRFVLPFDPEQGSADVLAALPLEGAPIGIEIGFGMGQALVAWAGERPDWNLIGIEVYQPGIGSLMLQLEKAALDNVRVLEADAVDVFATLPDASVRSVHIFFPDPWPKARHAKRRIVQPAFARELARVLEPGGEVHLATDWEAYAEWMLEVLEAEPGLQNLSGSGFATDREDRPTTRFEARGERLGHAVWDLRYQRKR